jgi:hypothetical protein
VIVIVLVIDSREASKKHPSLGFVHVLRQRPAFAQKRSKLDNEHEHDSGSKAMNDNLGFCPLYFVLVIVLVLVIDSRDVSKKHPSLAFVDVLQQRAAFDPETVKAR